MQIDDEFKNLIPQLTNEEFKQLEENILKEGCREPLIIWNNTIIDGHNRYEICSKHNVDFKTISKDFSNKEEAKMWIIKNQFGRRNLSVYDRSVLALKLESLFKEKAKENQGRRTDLTLNQQCEEVESKDFLQKSAKSLKESEIVPIDTRKEIAKIAGTSHDTIAKVKKIEEKAPKEVKEKIKNGEMSINQAYGYAKTYEYLENEIKDEIPKEKTEEEKYVEEEFKKIEEESAIQRNVHNAIYKILCIDISKEDLDIWYEGLEKSYLDTLDEDMERAIEQYQTIKEFIKEKRMIRRIK